MSAITETEPGGEMVCILEFSARPRDSDDRPVPGARRTFHIGERVRYMTTFYKSTPEDNPTGYMAVFEPLDKGDGKRYIATPSYFVTLECWEGLREHFASNRNVPAERPSSSHPHHHVKSTELNSPAHLVTKQANPPSPRKHGHRGQHGDRDA